MECSKYHFELKKPCSCEKCSYHINYPNTYNCLTQYLIQNGTNFALTEKSALLNITKHQFKENVQKAIDESRVAKLDEVIGRGNEFEYVPFCNICVVCGKECKSARYKFDNGISYCSPQCLSRLPIKVSSLMNRLGVDEYTLFYALVTTFSGYSVCEFLSMSETEFKKWVLKLTGIKLKEVSDIAPPTYEIKLDKIEKSGNLKFNKSLLYNEDEVFEKVDSFLSM